MIRRKTLFRPLIEELTSANECINIQKKLLSGDKLLATLSGPHHYRQAQQLYSQLESELIPDKNNFPERAVLNVMYGYFALQLIAYSNVLEEIRILGKHPNKGYAQDIQFEFVDTYAELSQFSLLLREVLMGGARVESEAAVLVALKNVSRSAHWRMAKLHSRLETLVGINLNQEKRERIHHMLATTELLWLQLERQEAPRNDTRYLFQLVLGADL